MLVSRSMAATILSSPLRLISASTSSLAADSATTSHTRVVIGPCQSWVTVLKIAQAASFTKARTSWALETLLLAEANNMVSMRALNR